MKYLTSLLTVFLLVSLGYGVTIRSSQGNFVVTADSQQFACQVGECAEKARKSEAIAWLGHELEPWSEPCPIKVTIANHSGGGATGFSFGGGVPSMHMSVEGKPEKILSCVVPHEVCHTIWATHLKKPTIRWADEGAAVTCEDREELVRQDKICRDLLNQRRAIPLSTLLTMQDYPSSVDQYGRKVMNSDRVMALYAQGYSVTNYLISLKGRQQFLYFVWHGQQRTWDEALRASYGIDDVATLDKEWKSYLMRTKGVAQGQDDVVSPVNRSDNGSNSSTGNPMGTYGTAPAVRVGGGEGQPTSPSSVSPSNTDRALSLLVEAQQLLARDVKQLKENDRKQDQRLDRIERELGWNQPRVQQQNQPRTSLPSTIGTQPYQPGIYPQGGYAVPTAAPPSMNQFVQPFSQPYCPTGH